MTKEQAEKKAREIAKQSVRDYFEREGIENFNWEQFGRQILKKELFHTLKLYIPHYNTETKKWCVMLTHGNKIVSE